MARFVNHGNRKKEKGLTLVETVVALAVILIISASTVSVAVFSSSALNFNRVKSFFIRETNNFADMFITYNSSDFASAVNSTTNKDDVTGYQSFNLYYDDSFKYVLETNKFYILEIKYDGSTSSLTMDAKDNSNKTIYSRSVSR